MNSDPLVSDDFWRELRHAFGTHLNSISGYCQLLLTGSYGEMTAEQAAVVEKILRSCRELTRVIDRVNDGHSPRVG